MSYQNIKRAVLLPTYAVGRTETIDERVDLVAQQLAQLQQAYIQLAREVIDCHNSIQIYQKAITGGATTYALVLTAAFFDVLYTATAIPDWNTTIWISAQSRTGCTFSFGTAAPGGGGTLRIQVIR